MNLIVTVILSLIGVTMAPPLGPPHHPEGGPPSLEAGMARLYELAADDINRLAGRAIRELNVDPDRRASQFREIRAAQLSQQVQLRLARLGGDTRRLLEGPLAQTVDRAIKRGDDELAKIGLAPNPTLARVPGSEIGFSLVNDQAVEVIAQDTINKTESQIVDALGKSMDQHGRGAVELFRSLSTSVLTTANPAAEARVNDAIARGLISGNPTLADRAIRELFAEGSPQAIGVRKLGNQYIEVGKATMTVRQYAATVTRTRTREATVEARHRRLQERGVNLVQITGKNSRNFCTAFIGLVCSLGPAPSIDGLNIVELATLPGGGPPFHPNCSKGTAPYIHELASPARQREADRAYAVYAKRVASGDLLKPMKSR